MLEPATDTLLPAFFRRLRFLISARTQIGEIHRPNGTQSQDGNSIPPDSQSSGRTAFAWSSQGTHTTGYVEASVWAICFVATSFAAFLTQRSAIIVDLGSLLVALTILGFLLTVHVVYRRWRPSPVLSNLCGALLAMLLSGAVAGIISLVGLRNNATFIDADLARWDRAAGFDLPAVVAWAAANPAWSQLLSVTYDSSFPLLFGLSVLLAIVRRFDHLWILTFVFASTIVACASISVIWPAKGAFAFFGYPASLLEHLPIGAGTYHLSKLEYFRNEASPLLSFANLQGVVTFPSFHCCLALMIISASRHLRWLFPISLIWNSLVIASTVPIGGHYAIDLPCGAVVWLVATGTAIALMSLSSRRAQGSSGLRADASHDRLTHGMCQIMTRAQVSES
ncbi:phosphatase PAP2 family protein [Bradyrhizobium sp. HKCCYLRH1062]|uniref:phosphatase PAP2 family protein n=1 Tax=unclassified Bradyrhizobium TaxID=2631580 RepID=UPI003EBA6347